MRSILITGASSGIGLATTKVLAASGMRVFAGVRKFSSELGAIERVEQVELDVSGQDSIHSARGEVERQLGDRAGLFALVNNAGIGEAAPLEVTDNFRRIFEVNVFGTVAVTREFLPLLRRDRGRIVNIGSVGGLVTVPFGSALCASKHAIESISDALRLELYSSGIFVTCIQPASINSGAGDKMEVESEAMLASLPPGALSRYEGMVRTFLKRALASENAGSPPEVVARAVFEVLSSPRPPARRLVGKNARTMRFLGRHVPDALRDALFRRVFLGNPEFGSADA